MLKSLRPRDKPLSPSTIMLISLGMGILLVYFAFLKPAIWGVDGNEVVQVAYSLVTKHTFSVPAEFGGQVGADGQNYSTRYLLLPLLITPFVALGIGVSSWLGLPEIPVATIFALTSSIFITTATALLVALLALRMGSSQKGAYAAAICYAFGTIAITYAHTLFSEPLLGLVTVACVYLAFGQSWREWLGSSILAALAIVTKPAGIVVGPVISLYFFAKRYPRAVILGPILLPCLGLLIYGFYNYIRFGNLSITGQPVSLGLTSAGVPQRFLGFLFGTGMGGGLIWYCPPVILSVVGFYKAMQSKFLESLTLIGIVLGFLLLHSFWFCCGWDWGPRFLVPIIPLLMALTGLLAYRSRRLLVLLSMVGFLISAPTLISFFQRYYWEFENTGREAWTMSLWANFTDTPILNVWGSAFRQVMDAIDTDVRAFLEHSDATTKAQIITVWWWMLPIAGIPRWLGALASGASVAIGILLLRWGWFQLGQQTSLPPAIRREVDSQ